MTNEQVPQPIETAETGPALILTDPHRWLAIVLALVDQIEAICTRRPTKRETSEVTP